MKMTKNILDLIGNTPMTSIDKLNRNYKANVKVKLEYLNPSGSLKDRIALEMIEQAEKEGILNPGDVIVEASTGNTGISLALIGKIKGYKVIIYETMPETMSYERVKMMKNFGAEVELIAPDKSTDHDKSVDGSEVELPGRLKCKEMEEQNQKVWWARQFSNPANVSAHNTTAREIIAQTSDNIDVFVASIGTGGTLMGIAEVLKEKYPDIKIIGVQPASSKIPIIVGQSYPTNDISGGIISDMLAKKLIDEVVKVNDAEAIGMTHRLWREEGFFAGVSSGANILVSLREGEKLGEDKTVVTVLPDNGYRYIREEHYTT